MIELRKWGINWPLLGGVIGVIIVIVYLRLRDDADEQKAVAQPRPMPSAPSEPTPPPDAAVPRYPVEVTPASDQQRGVALVADIASRCEARAPHQAAPVWTVVSQARVTHAAGKPWQVAFDIRMRVTQLQNLTFAFAVSDDTRQITALGFDASVMCALTDANLATWPPE